MSVRVLSWVFNHSSVTSRSDLLVLLVLASHAHDDGSSAYPSVQTIAGKARLTRRGVQLALRRLEAAAAIEVTAGGGQHRPITYRVLMDSGANSLRGEVSSPGERSDAQGRTQRRSGANPPSPEASETSVEASLQQRAIEPAILDQVLGILTTVGPVSQVGGAQAIATAPNTAYVDAAHEVAKWAKRERLRSVIAAYRRALADQPDLPPSLLPPCPPSQADKDAWATARDRLRTVSGFDIWLAPLELLGRRDNALVLGAPDEIRSWVVARYAHALDEVLGHDWHVDTVTEDAPAEERAA